MNDDENRRALARCEEQWLREPAWRTGEDTLHADQCAACGAHLDPGDDATECDECREVGE